MIITIEKALQLLNSNEVVAIPTETVYGLAGKVDSEIALKKIFSIKERPFFDPLIVHSFSKNELKKYTQKWNLVQELLADRFWPGPLTLIIEKNDQINPLITAGLSKVGVRIPNHPLTLELLKLVQIPLAAPSANKFTKVSPTQESHIEKEFMGLVPILSGGSSEVGIESTVVDVIQNNHHYEIKIYRPGKISKDEIAQFLNEHKISFTINYEPSPVAPGQIKHHYMPQIPLIVLSDKLNFKQFDLSSINIDKLETIHLSTDPVIASRELYHQLRIHAEKGATALLISLSPEVKNQDEWKGILNRLEKAATIFLI